MENSVGFFCGPHCGPMLHDLCSSFQSGGNLECSRASGTIGLTVHLGRPLDGVDRGGTNLKLLITRHFQVQFYI